MPSLIQRLGPFRRMSAAARRAGLIDGLRYAEANEITLLVDELSANPSIEGYLLLLDQYYQIDKKARHKILEGGVNLSGALSKAVREGDPRTRQTALQLIEIREDKRCIAALASPFGRETETAENLALAARILRSFAQLLTRSVIPEATDRLAFEQLDAVVVKALDSYPGHRQPEVLLAAALLSKMPGVAMGKFLADDDHPAHFALRGVLKKFGDEFVADSALAWLNLDSLAPQLSDRLSVLARTPQLGAILASIHLAQLPRVRARLQRLNSRYPSTLPLGEAMQELDSEAQAALPSWLRVIPMSMPDRVTYLGEGLGFATPGARLAALRVLMGLGSAEADVMVESFCFDEDELVARIAVRHCLRVRRSAEDYGELLPLLGRLADSPHGSVRALSAGRMRIEDFESWWELSLEIEESTDSVSQVLTEDGERGGRGTFSESKSACLALGRCFLKSYCAEELAAGLRAKLLSTDHSMRKRAVRLVRQFDLADLVELELLALAGEDDSLLTSEIVTTLSGIRSEAAAEVLWLALGHANIRVRANAIESLQYRADLSADDWRALLSERVISDDNRVRANAVRALYLIDPAESERQLKLMLGDGRPLHRISGLWVSGRTGQLGCAEKVASIAAEDEMKPIRVRAERTAGQLLGRLAAMRLAKERPVGLDLSASADAGAPLVGLGVGSRQGGSRSALTTMLALFLVSRFTAVVSFGQATTSGGEDAGDERSKWSEITDAFVGRDGRVEGRATPTFDWSGVGWLLSGVLLIGLVVYAFRLQRRDHERFGPAYRGMASELKLNLFDLVVVNYVAGRAGLVNGVGLLLSEGTFEHHFGSCVARSGAVHGVLLRLLMRMRLKGIRERLFG